MLDNGDILTTAIVVQKNSNNNDEKFVQFISKAIILSNGAHQTLHPLFFKSWFPFLD
jgi:hypothetical protein